MTDIEKMQKVTDWFNANRHLFKLDQYYGIEIIAELYQLVNEVSL